MTLQMFIKRWKLLLLLFNYDHYYYYYYFFLYHRSNDLGVWYDDKSMYKLLLTFMWVYFEGSRLVTIESNGDSFFSTKLCFGLIVLQLPTVPIVTMNVQIYFFNLIIITFHRNDPWDVRKFTQGWKCSKWSPFPW